MSSLDFCCTLFIEIQQSKPLLSSSFLLSCVLCLSLLVSCQEESSDVDQTVSFTQCRLSTGYLQPNAAISARFLANVIAQRTVGKLLNSCLSKKEPPGNGSSVNEILLSTHLRLLIINPWSPPLYHGRT